MGARASRLRLEFIHLRKRRLGSAGVLACMSSYNHHRIINKYKLYGFFHHLIRFVTFYAGGTPALKSTSHLYQNVQTPGARFIAPLRTAEAAHLLTVPRLMQLFSFVHSQSGFVGFVVKELLEAAFPFLAGQHP